MSLPVLMTHIIPFFPNEEKSLAIAHALLNADARYLEVQFAFSDPSADGPLIEDACQVALRQGFTVDRGFAFIRTLQEESTALREGKAKIFLMTYASLLFARGVERFVQDAAQEGVSGLIVPDLPLDSDEGLRTAADTYGVHVIPVLAVNSREERIRLIQEGNPEYIYCVLRPGITGARTELGEKNIRFLDRAGSGGAKILAGFGISEHAQVKALTDHAHAAVVGSAFVREIKKTDHGNIQDCVKALSKLVRTLLGH